MNISGTGMVAFDALIKPDFIPKTKLALRWVRLSDGNYIASDRGITSDLYEAQFRLYKNATDIDTFIDRIEDNRVAGNHVVTLDSLTSTEHIFGEDVDHSGTIDVTVMDIGDRKQHSWKTFSVKVVVRAVTSDVSFVGSTTLPTLQFLDRGYTNDSDTQVRKKVAYDGTQYYTDRDAGTGFFEGTFVFDITDMRNLRRYLSAAATGRGKTISIPDVKGVTALFGIRRPGGYPRNVKIVDWEDLGMRDVQTWRMRLKMAEVA